MANSLLDFVISLVRDPDAAARYAANPAQAIADAHLTNVTSADVNNLIPMVSDSLSMSNPAGGISGAPVTDHGNVWASGAAAAALDAFSSHPPVGVVDQRDQAHGVIDQPSMPGGPGSAADPHPFVADPHQPSVLLTSADVPDSTIDHGGFPADDSSLWDHSTHAAAHPHTVEPDHHGFGLHG
ncbi:MAG TPA: Rv0340 family IniB-related protein [Mycobacterium sp.]|nr:Rv0340 family IniB-related protein [Mycobacterium sp.]